MTVAADGQGDWSANARPAPRVLVPASVSDVLYLIAAVRADMVDPESIRQFTDAGLYLIRGDLESALVSINKALDDLDPSLSAYGDLIAFRMFLVAMIDQGSDRWKTSAAGDVDLGAGAPKIASLCIESNTKWHSGSLFDGLLMNQNAVQCADQDNVVWNLFARTLLAKKLSDMHVSHQAVEVIAIIQSLVDNFGLHAFESVVPSLRSLLHLQDGQFDQALEVAGRSLAVAAERASAVGVKLALSVSAMAHLGRGECDRAVQALDEFKASTTGYVLPDSIARAAVTEIALVAAGSGPAAAAEQIRAKWDLLATGSGCFIEDLTRPAWLVSVARRAGDLELAARSLAAIERLAANNPGVPLLGKAAGHARTAFQGETPILPSVLDVGTTQRRRRRTARGHPVRSPSERQPDIGLSSLSEREDEIARLVGRGMTNRQVAKELGISPHTVNFHLRGIFKKLAITTRVKLGQLIAQLDEDAPLIPRASR